MSKSLHWVDILFMAVNIATGLYQSLKPKGKRKDDTADTENYFLGGRQMSWLPMTISLVMSALSANLVIGGPAQVVYQGSEYWMLCVGIMLGNMVAAALFVPLLYPLRLNNTSEVGPAVCTVISSRGFY